MVHGSNQSMALHTKIEGPEIATASRLGANNATSYEDSHDFGTPTNSNASIFDTTNSRLARAHVPYTYHL
jgi:hypothetical protein